MRLRRAAVALCAVVLLVAGCGALTRWLGDAPAALPTATPTGRISFGAADGVALEGQIIGRGATALVFSNGFGATMDSWQPLPEELAARGYLALLYDYRGTGESRGSDDAEARDRDLRAAVTVVRARGARSVVLIGASYGGLLSATLAAELSATALVVLSAPLTTSTLTTSTLGIGDDELRDLTMPKLFMVSRDDTLFAGDVQHMDDVAPPPKSIQVYPGDAHGAAILRSATTGPDATARLEAFLQQYAPPGDLPAPAATPAGPSAPPAGA